MVSLPLLEQCLSTRRLDSLDNFYHLLSDTVSVRLTVCGSPRHWGKVASVDSLDRDELASA